MNTPPAARNRQKLIDIFTWSIIALGIVLRIAVYLQNRNLFIDEANLARNICYRSYTQLTLPLSFEQYAPPIFLWILKLFTSIFGYGEMAFRIYPLLTGIAALIILYKVLRAFVPANAAWYPLSLMAFSYIMVRYSSELKQYMPDAFVTLALLWLALKVDIDRYKPGVFALLWLVAGSLAIWASMPAVFILPGIGLYYLLQAFKGKKYKYVAGIFFAGLCWITQFAYYYITVLQPQVNSQYLQEFHKPFFLFALPKKLEDMQHNIEVLNGVLGEVTGFTALSLGFNILLICIGFIVFAKRETFRSLLVLLPLVLVILAAALNKYSLIPRVAIFTMPLTLIVIGKGFNVLLRARYASIKLAAVLIAVFCAVKQSSVDMLWKPVEVEQMTDALKFLQQKEIRYGNQVYIHNGARPAFIYYTQIHPARAQWKDYNTAHLLWWNSGYDDLMSTGMKKIAFIATSISNTELNERRETIYTYYRPLDSLEKPGCHVIIAAK